MFEFIKNWFAPTYQLPAPAHTHCFLMLSSTGKYVECNRCLSRVSKSSGIAPHCAMPNPPRVIPMALPQRRVGMPRGHVPPRAMPAPATSRKRRDMLEELGLPLWVIPEDLSAPQPSSSPPVEPARPAFVSGGGGDFTGGGASDSWPATAAPAPDPTPAPAPVYEAPAPWPSPTPAPTPYEAPAPSPAPDYSPSPSPAPYESPAPSPSYDAPAPSPSYDAPAPSPSFGD